MIYFSFFFSSKLDVAK